VRTCHLPLSRGGAAWTCDRGHTFDIARSGYVNLLQPQDRRSASPGDPPEVIDARARVLAAGLGRDGVEALVSAAVAHLRGAHPVVVDLGCGSGDAVAALHARYPITGIGIDLSGYAVDRAARRFTTHTWVVANADRRLPLLDASVDAVVSLNARRNPPECRRVLKDGGWLVVATPGATDLIELREAVQGARVERDRTEAMIAEHAREFTVIDRVHVEERHHVTGDLLRDLLRGTYRGARASLAERLHRLPDLDVTLAVDVVAMRRRETTMDSVSFVTA
jgi:23S rRNA (guanine745-N1)-methyltransferase